MDTGKRIKEQRKIKGLTQKSLAQILGKSLRMVQKYEDGEVTPSVEQLQKIATALGVTVSYLLGDTDDPHTIRAKMHVETNINGGGSIATKDKTIEDEMREEQKKPKPIVLNITRPSPEEIELDKRIRNKTATPEEMKEWIEKMKRASKQISEMLEQLTPMLESMGINEPDESLPTLE